MELQHGFETEFTVTWHNSRWPQRMRLPHCKASTSVYDRGGQTTARGPPALAETPTHVEFIYETSTIFIKT